MKGLDVKVPMGEIIEEMKRQAGEGWCCTRVYLKIRKGLSYILLGGFLYLSSTLFPYELVKEGKLPFTYEQVKNLSQNINLMMIVSCYAVNMLVFSQLIECYKWVSKNSEKTFTLLTHSISYLFLVVFGYGLAIA